MTTNAEASTVIIVLYQFFYPFLTLYNVHTKRSSGFTPSKQQRLHVCKEKKRKIMFRQYGTLSSFSDSGLRSSTLLHAKNVAGSVRLGVPVPLLLK